MMLQKLIPVKEEQKVKKFKKVEMIMFFSKENKFNLKSFIRKAKTYDQFETKYFEKLVSHYLDNHRSVVPDELGLKLIVISDTHGDLAFGSRFEAFMSQVSEYDLCVILGDIYGYELEKILQIVPKERIVALRGNHDSFDVYEKFGIRNINGKAFTYKGIKFVGIEGSFKYKKAEFPSYTHYESLYLASKMPQKADALLSHDCMFTESKYDMAHSGLAGITYYVYENAVQWHIHGHIHKSYQNSYINGTREKSVYGCECLEI